MATFISSVNSNSTNIIPSAMSTSPVTQKHAVTVRAPAGMIPPPPPPMTLPMLQQATTEQKLCSFLEDIRKGKTLKKVHTEASTSLTQRIPTTSSVLNTAVKKNQELEDNIQTLLASYENTEIKERATKLFTSKSEEQKAEIYQILISCTDVKINNSAITTEQYKEILTNIERDNLDYAWNLFVKYTKTDVFVNSVVINLAKANDRAKKMSDSGEIAVQEQKEELEKTTNELKGTLSSKRTIFEQALNPSTSSVIGKTYNKINVLAKPTIDIKALGKKEQIEDFKRTLQLSEMYTKNCIEKYNSLDMNELTPEEALSMRNSIEALLKIISNGLPKESISLPNLKPTKKEDINSFSTSFIKTTSMPNLNANSSIKPNIITTLLDKYAPQKNAPTLVKPSTVSFYKNAPIVAPKPAKALCDKVLKKYIERNSQSIIATRINTTTGKPSLRSSGNISRLIQMFNNK